MLAQSDKCTGCGSCFSVCPTGSISMQPDAEGFLYPQLHTSSCIECGICESACPVITPIAPHSKSTAFAAQNLNAAARDASSSGGIFSALAELVLSHHGYVCAAVYDLDFQVRHILSNSLVDLPRMRSAKYAQSQAAACYPQIKALLNDHVVIFVGTPCQVAGLRAYLGGDAPNLILADMICHGVPSPLVWKKYLTERQSADASGAPILAVNQRSKVSGWGNYNYSVKIDYQNGASYCVHKNQDAFSCGFVNDLFSRPSCAQCSFKGLKRHSDITLADYWGVWTQHPEFDDDRGTSLILIHSEKGRCFYEQAKPFLRQIPVDAAAAISSNPSAIQSSAPHPKRADFFRDLPGASSVCSLIDRLLTPEAVKSTLFQKIKEKLSHWTR